MQVLQFYVASALFAIMASSAFALNVPVAEDSSSNEHGKLTNFAGSASVLNVSKQQTALLRFNLSDLNVVPNTFHPGNITSAVLQLYIVSAKAPADLTLQIVDSAWSEKFAGKKANLPTIVNAQPAIAIPASDLIGKRFMTVDVTSAVINALTNGSDFGFAITTSDPSAKIAFSSKEGTVNGWSPSLDIEANLATDGNGSVSTNSLLFSGAQATVSLGAVTIFQTAATDNLFAGLHSGAANVTGYGNTGFGSFALNSNVITSLNTAIGYYALSKTTNGSANTAIGGNALTKNTSGSQNTAVGANVLSSNTSGSLNSAIGFNALQLNDTGSANAAFGASALGHNISGQANTAVGDSTLSGNTTGSQNVAIGSGAMLANLTGSQNVAVGLS